MIISTVFASSRLMNIVETVLALAILAIVVGGIIGWFIFVGLLKIGPVLS